MTERPILFSAPMVRALLAGTKTQTRRVVKPGDLEWMDVHQGLREADNAERCPYGQPGDRLWVRETWRAELSWQTSKPSDIPSEAAIFYEADGQQRNNGMGCKFRGKLRPSMFMPRWASRITLEITGVRVERLQDISEADAQAEGCALEAMTPIGDDNGSAIWGPGGYCALWEQINGPGSWAANPWVWVVEFRRLS